MKAKAKKPRKNLQLVAQRRIGKFSIIVERDAVGNFIGSVPGLAGCHAQARTQQTLMKRMREVIELTAAPHDVPITPAQRLELDARLKEYKRTPNSGADLPTVLARIRKNK